MKKCPICGKWLIRKDFGTHWFLGECRKDAYEESKKQSEEKKQEERK